MHPSGTDLILWNTSVFIFPLRRVGILWCYADSMLLPPVDNLFVYDPHIASIMSSSSIFGPLKGLSPSSLLTRDHLRWSSLERGV
jgi:hypothetical protein